MDKTKFQLCVYIYTIELSVHEEKNVHKKSK